MKKLIYILVLNLFAMQMFASEQCSLIGEWETEGNNNVARILKVDNTFKVNVVKANKKNTGITLKSLVRDTKTTAKGELIDNSTGKKYQYRLMIVDNNTLLIKRKGRWPWSTKSYYWTRKGSLTSGWVKLH